MRQPGRFFDLLQDAKEVGRLNHDRRGVIAQLGVEIGQIDLAGRSIAVDRPGREALVLRVGVEHLAVLGMQCPRHEEAVPAGDARRHHASLGDCRGTVVHRRVGDIHAGELRDHRLKLEDRGQDALGNLGLVRRVRGQELAARRQRVDHDRPEVAVYSCAEKACVAPRALFRAGLEEVVDLEFRLALGNS